MDCRVRGMARVLFGGVRQPPTRTAVGPLRRVAAQCHACSGGGSGSGLACGPGCRWITEVAALEAVADVAGCGSPRRSCIFPLFHGARPGPPPRGPAAVVRHVPRGLLSPLVCHRCRHDDCWSRRRSGLRAVVGDCRSTCLTRVAAATATGGRCPRVAMVRSPCSRTLSR